ncbi:MAG: hypothetical protein EXS35_14255 [Pedosphaera sp.]|nr:hypothetical protein [Pedosphaera sp.]
MKTIRALLVAVALAGLGLSVRAQTINGIKAIVHDSVVTFQEVETYTAEAAKVLERQYRGQPAVLEREVEKTRIENLEERLERQLILHDFKTGGYNIPEAILQEAVDEDIRSGFGGREKLIKTLQARGMTYEKFRQQARENIIITALRGKNISQEIVVSPHRIESYYLANRDKYKVEDEVKLRMIVLNKPVESEAGSVRKLAGEIRAKIKEGAAFSQMADIHSQGTQRREGGLWGWVEKSVLRPELAAAAFAMKPGELSDVLEAGNAVYLMLVEDKRAAHTKALSEVRDDVEQTLRSVEHKRLEKDWIERLKKKTFIRYF